MKIEIGDEFIDEVMEKIFLRLRETKDGVWCNRCKKRIGWEDAFVLCVGCQTDIGPKEMKKLGRETK